MTGLPVEQVTELVSRLEEYLGGWQPTRGRRREMDLPDAVMVVLFYYRHDISQEVAGVVFGLSQPTVSRLITELEEPIAAVLDCEVPELHEVIEGRVVIPDGTQIPTRNRAGHRELYSGKRRSCGAAVQVLSDTEGRLMHVGEPLPGKVHDITAFRETGLVDLLEQHLADHRVMGDLGYVGEPVVTPVKKPRNGELSPAQKECNKKLSGVRSAVERCIAHLKNWKILAAGFRRPLRKLAVCLAAVTALEFYRINGRHSE